MNIYIYIYTYIYIYIYSCLHLDIYYGIEHHNLCINSTCVNITVKRCLIGIKMKSSFIYFLVTAIQF